MTAKEMAEHLIFRFNAETIMQQPYNHGIHMEKAKQCAIISAHETYHAILKIDKEKSKYWENIINELNAL
jgi:hypothetical protein